MRGLRGLIPAKPRGHLQRVGHVDRKAEILSSTGVTSLAGKPSIVGRPSGLTGGAGACGYNGVRRRDLDAHSNSGAVLGLGLATRFAAYLFLDLLDSFINGIGSPNYSRTVVLSCCFRHTGPGDR